jgi:hypothetical protein
LITSIGSSSSGALFFIEVVQITAYSRTIDAKS